MEKRTEYGRGRSPLRRRRLLVAEDDGSASLEFVTAGVILLVPLVYLVLTVSAIQAGSFAVEGAARQAARVYTQASSEDDGVSRAERAVTVALADYGMDRTAAALRITCEDPSSAGCLQRSSTVTVTVTARVGLPLVPDILDLSRAASVPVEATATQQVSRFWSDR